MNFLLYRASPSVIPSNEGAIFSRKPPYLFLITNTLDVRRVSIVPNVFLTTYVEIEKRPLTALTIWLDSFPQVHRS